MTAKLRVAALTWALGLASTCAAAADTAADRFAPKRGFSTDVWVVWKTVPDMVATPGFLDIYPDYPRTLPEGSFARLQGQGFDTLRIAADPAPLLALAGSAREEGLLANLRLRVLEAQAAGLKVILDLHTFPHPGQTGDIAAILASPTRFAAYLQMVGQVARRIADLNPDITALEVMNEPSQDCHVITNNPAASDWPAKLAQLHAVARAAAPRLPLVLSGACWGSPQALAVLDPAVLHDDNVIWSFHSYDPFEFSHQGAGWTDSPLMFLHDLPYPPALLTDASVAQIVAQAVVRAKAATGPVAAAATPAALLQIVTAYRTSPVDATSAPVAVATAWADAHGIPRARVLMGEFGALWVSDLDRLSDPASHNRFLAAKRGAAEAAGIGWAVWSYSGNFGITDPAGVIDPGVCASLGLTPC